MNMLNSIMQNIRGAISVCLYTAVLLMLGLIIIICTPIIFLIPVRSWRYGFQRHFLQKMPIAWGYLNRWVMQISARDKIHITGTDKLSPDGLYIMISNHRSWLDILILVIAFCDKLPPLKFFMKKELLWQLPVAGIACYALGFPFMSRHSHAEIRQNPSLKGKDFEATKKACQRLRNYPTTLINYLEGTRFTEKKRIQQESPYQHLLKPRTGGLAVVIQELHDALLGIVNVTIIYPKKTLRIWDFACGRFDKVDVHYELLPITPDLLGDYEDRTFRSHIQQYLNTVWQRKDALIDEWQP